MNYEGAIYRPPSEAKSLIIQITVGCSHNKCTFCSMYKDKKFRIKKLKFIKNELREARKKYKSIKRFFLADGDAFILKTKDLLEILLEIKRLFPECERVASYATPRDINYKSEKEIKLLNENGLKILYMGIESGSDKVLNLINKGSDSKDIIKAGKKAIKAGMKLSVTLISGLGGKKHMKEHAVQSAKVVSAINPHYLGLLTLMVEKDTEMYKKIKNKEMTLLKPEEVILETYEFIKNIDLTNCIFRSNHASNYILLRGTLNKDKNKLLNELREYIDGNEFYKEEKYRSL